MIFSAVVKGPVLSRILVGILIFNIVKYGRNYLIWYQTYLTHEQLSLLIFELKCNVLWYVNL